MKKKNKPKISQIICWITKEGAILFKTTKPSKTITKAKKKINQSK